MNNSGYGAGALRALDFHASGDNSDYEWNESERKWQWTAVYRDKVMGGEHEQAN